MVSLIKKTSSFLDRNKEGAVVGMLIASLVFIFDTYKPMDWLNRIMIHIPQQPWWYKLSVVLFIGISLGVLADSIHRPLV